MELRFEVLGPVRAWRGDTEVELGSPQQRAILAILLLHNGTAASPDQLIRATWGSEAPRAAIGMVRSYVSRLRSALGPVIESVAHGYALPKPSLDLTDFQRHISAARAGDLATRAAELRAALALWKGTPLGGVRGEYAEAERVRLENVQLTVIEDLAAADIELGRHAEAVADLMALVDRHPFRERPRELLMLALYRSGRQAEALALFDETRRVLSAELGIAPGPELREMHQRILVADPALTPAETVAPMPAQLPADTPFFVGRHQLLPQITAALRDGIPVGIEGLSGVGKTALAVHVGHRMASEFPDGTLFVDLNESPDPLAELLHAVGVVELPRTQWERQTLWRTLTSVKRMLIVIDNVRDSVSALLPSSGGVLMTARQRLYDPPHARWIAMGGLDEDESVMLLEHMIGEARVRAEPIASRRLAGITMGIPHLLQAMGNRIASRPKWTIASVTERAERRTPGAPAQPPECAMIERPFKQMLADLDQEQTRTLLLVSLIDSPDIGVRAAAALLDRPPTLTEDLLESLVDRHMLESTVRDRYRFLTPVKKFARARAVSDFGRVECEAALGRLAAYHESQFAEASHGLRQVTSV
ncbi:AfsR/SARP family transcriptional regulator [Kibdelosporangium aridum]|uniref:AfsR/SARP family transcriptional regulator n=1 Tax=Kibdelosporangium aridum TaxID=2030 RepID=UPI00068F3F9F